MLKNIHLVFLTWMLLRIYFNVIKAFLAETCWNKIKYFGCPSQYYWSNKKKNEKYIEVLSLLRIVMWFV